MAALRSTLAMAGPIRSPTLRPEIVLFGDSITQHSIVLEKAAGWGALIADHYSRKADVVVRGFSGYNSRWALILLDKIFAIPTSNPPLLTTVFFGANDASDPLSIHGFMHVPLQEYGKNLHQIVAHLKTQSDSARIVLITPPPISEKHIIKWAENEFGDKSGVPTRTNDFTKLYAEECVRVANEARVRVINTWAMFQEEPNWQEKFLSDGLHLTPEGSTRLFQELVKILDGPGLVPTINPNDLPWDYPCITDLGQEKDVVSTLKQWSTPK